jgi:membrane-anchored mycosin MYCP
MRAMPVPHRPRPRRALPVALALLLPTAGALVAPAVAYADDGPTVRLPVMRSQLTDEANCVDKAGPVATTLPWEQQSLDLARTWQFADGAGVTVAVVDTGVSTAAPALSGRVTAVGLAGTDCVGHGSFVATLVAAAPRKGIGFQGVAPRARVVGVRGTDKRGKATPDSVAEGIRSAVDAHAGVIEVSPALSTRSKTLDDAVAYAARHDALIVAGAVPDSSPTGSALHAGDTPPPPRDYWPAASPGVLSVLDLDVKGERAKDAYLPLRADLAAPGDGVIGNGPTGKGHFIGSGASLAAAYTAGAAALLRSASPDLDAQDVARRLMSTAYPADVPRLDPYAAVTTIGDTAAHPAAAADHQAPVSLPKDIQGAKATHRALITAAAGFGLVIAVAWAAAILPRGRARHWRPARR